MNPANNATEQPAEAAEPGEGRTPTKENTGPSHTSLTQRRNKREKRVSSVRQRDLTLNIKVGAVCGSAARTDLCGGQVARSVPTATLIFFRSTIYRILHRQSPNEQYGIDRPPHAIGPPIESVFLTFPHRRTNEADSGTRPRTPGFEDGVLTPAPGSRV